jgi:hypothetical protein
MPEMIAPPTGLPDMADIAPTADAPSEVGDTQDTAEPEAVAEASGPCLVGVKRAGEAGVAGQPVKRSKGDRKRERKGDS